MRNLRYILLGIACSVATLAAEAQTNLFYGATVEASSTNPRTEVQMAVDGKFTRRTTWESAPTSRPPHILEVTLPRYCDIDSIVIYTGIPEKEKKQAERGQHDGFWCVKNFILQYWDDANWTDIEGTLTTENRLDRVSFTFKTPITSFKFRIHSTDGEPIRIMEFEGWGRVNKQMAKPAPVNTPSLQQEGGGLGKNATVRATVYPEQVGHTMQYVGYNQGYFMPGGNAPAWLEYADVNAVRLWADGDTYVNEKWIDTSSEVASAEDFERLKADLLANPESEKYLKWSKIEEKANRPVPSTNTMVFGYALDQLKSIGAEVLIQSGFGKKRYNSSWQNKWTIWQQFYGLAFYAARRGDVSMFAMKNEPNHRHAGPMPLDLYVELMKVASDAVHCAVADVNRLYGKSLDCRFVGPVTAGTNTNWWAAVAASEGTDYLGRPMTTRENVQLFSTHSYNIPAVGYKGKVESIDKILKANHPQGKTKPIIFTEIGRWMNAYLIDKYETMDSPSLFVEWAGTYTQNMLGGGYGMWAFKFANTTSSTYPQGIKSGHHYTWKGLRYAEDAMENIALGCPVEVCGTDQLFSAEALTDGDKSDSSVWAFTADGPKSITIDLGGEREIGALTIYSGSSYGVFTAPDRVRKFKTEVLCDGVWTTVKEATQENNRYGRCGILLNKAVKGEKVRLTFADQGRALVREVKIFAPNEGAIEKGCFDVAGTQRTAQTVRLFAKGFKQQRPLLRTDLSVRSDDLDVCTSQDEQGNTYVWIVQRGVHTSRLELDMRRLGVGPNTPLLCEEVSNEHYGDGRILATDRYGVLNMTIPAQSVTLLSLHAPKAEMQTIRATRSTTLLLGEATKGPKGYTAVEMNAAGADHNAVTAIDFDLSGVDIASAGRIVVGVSGRSNDEAPYRLHAYVVESKAGSVRKWSDVEQLHPTQSRIVGGDYKVAGEISFRGEEGYYWLDVTKALKRLGADHCTLLLVRELREPGDDLDKGRSSFVAGHKSPTAPVLKVW